MAEHPDPLDPLDRLRAILAQLAEERERTGTYTKATWAAVCAQLERLTPDEARRVSWAVRDAVTNRPQ
jgi:hypothetical protein